MMTVCDLAAITKPWEIQKKVRLFCFSVFTLFYMLILFSSNSYIILIVVTSLLFGDNVSIIQANNAISQMSFISILCQR